MIWNARNESKCIKILKNLLLNWDNNLPNDTILNAHRYDIEISNVLKIVSVCPLQIILARGQQGQRIFNIIQVLKIRGKIV